MLRYEINYISIMSVLNERRAEKRDPCNVKIEFSIDSPDCATRDCGPWINFTSDISFKGMGLYSRHPIREGQKIKIFLNHISNDPIVARARWCRRFNNELFRIGVLYD